MTALQARREALTALSFEVGHGAASLGLFETVHHPGQADRRHRGDVSAS